MKSNNTIFFEHYLGVPFDKLYLIKSVKCFRGTKEFPSVEGLFQYNVLLRKYEEGLIVIVFALGFFRQGKQLLCHQAHCPVLSDSQNRDVVRG